MQDRPNADELLEAVAEFLEQKLLPTLEGHLAFHTRVAINVLAILRRERALAPAAEAAELERLRALLGREGDLATLTRALAEAIAQGRIALDDPRLHDHLWQTALAKLAVDQPNYASYRRALAERGAEAGERRP